jgi:hypothetical protein
MTVSPADVAGLPGGQGWPQAGELDLALSACGGVEPEIRQKNARLRTHAVVGLGAALFMLISKYGFSDVIRPRLIADPSRVAAQVVSGVGSLGTGLIFVRCDAVRSLTTAAAVWVTAAIAAAAAGLAALASRSAPTSAAGTPSPSWPPPSGRSTTLTPSPSARPAPPSAARACLPEYVT